MNLTDLQKLAGIPVTEGPAYSVHIPLDDREYQTIMEHIMDAGIAIHGNSNKFDSLWHQNALRLIAQRLKQQMLDGKLIQQMWADDTFDPLIKHPAF